MEDLVALGVSTSVRVRGFQSVSPPDYVAEKLDLGEGDQVVRIDKTRFIEGAPFSLVVNYLPEEIGSRLSPDDLSEKPLLVVLEEKLGIKADEALQSIEATIAGADVAALLEIRVGSPLLKVERTVFDIQGGPVEHVSVLYRADKYFYTVRLKRERTDDAVGWSTKGIATGPGIGE
jgi:GntR family transcriptional regulator